MIAADVTPKSNRYIFGLTIGGQLTLLHAWSLYYQLNPIFLKKFFTKISISSRFGYIIMTILFY